MTKSTISLPGDRPEFKILDKHGREGSFDETIATISAGYREGNRPVVSRDGTIYLHDPDGHAERLKEVLEARRKKSLTIAFVHDHLDDIVKQRYAAYSAGKCLWSGNTKSMTVFGPEVKVYQAGTPEYARVMAHKDTALHYSIYFTLAEWIENGARVDLADGFGYYRIRTGSFHSVANLQNEFRAVRDIWRGPVKGIPFELTIRQRQTNGPDGVKRTYPVWSFRVKPPKNLLSLTSDNFRTLLLSSNEAAAALSLPAPVGPSPEQDAADAAWVVQDSDGAPVEPTNTSAQTSEDDVSNIPADEEQGIPADDEPLDADFVDVPTERQLRNLMHNKDPKQMTARWFAAVKGSHLDADEARADFLARHVEGVSSLARIVDLLEPEKFDTIIIAAEDEIKERKKEDESQAKLAAPQGWHPSVTPAHAKALVDVVRYLGLKRVEVYPFISMVIGAHVHGRGEVIGEHIVTVLKATGTVDGALEWNYSESKAADLLMDFERWQVNEGVEGVL